MKQKVSFVSRWTKGLQRKTDFFAYVISGERSTNSPRRCVSCQNKSVCEKLAWSLTSENRPKTDVRPFCTKAFNLKPTTYNLSAVKVCSCAFLIQWKHFIRQKIIWPNKTRQWSLSLKILVQDKLLAVQWCNIARCYNSFKPHHVFLKCPWGRKLILSVVISTSAHKCLQGNVWKLAKTTQHVSLCLILNQ